MGIEIYPCGTWMGNGLVFMCINPYTHTNIIKNQRISAKCFWILIYGWIWKFIMFLYICVEYILWKWCQLAMSTLEPFGIRIACVRFQAIPLALHNLCRVCNKRKFKLMFIWLVNGRRKGGGVSLLASLACLYWPTVMEQWRMKSRVIVIKVDIVGDSGSKLTVALID